MFKSEARGSIMGDLSEMALKLLLMRVWGFVSEIFFINMTSKSADFGTFIELTRAS